jgi:hypothetical protein
VRWLAIAGLFGVGFNLEVFENSLKIKKRRETLSLAATVSICASLNLELSRHF